MTAIEELALLRRVREDLAGGWIQGRVVACVNGKDRHCLVGAISFAVFGKPVPPIVRASATLDAAYHSLVDLLCDAAHLHRDVVQLIRWNDMVEQTQEKVLAAVDAAIRVREKEVT